MNALGKKLYCSLIYLFLYAPIAVLIIFSFNNATFSPEWKGFTLDWYHQLLGDVDLLVVATHSFIVAILSSTFASLLGGLAAISLYRYRFFGRNFLHGLIFILIVLPDIVMGISLLILFALLKLQLGFFTLLIAHTTLCLPFVAVVVIGRISDLDKNIFEAAKDLGAGDFVLFKRVLLPLLWPAIATGWLLSFTLSFDDVIISFFVTGPSFQTLPLHIYSMVKLGVKPEINALSAFIFALTMMTVLLSHYFVSRTKKSKEVGAYV